MGAEYSQPVPTTTPQLPVFCIIFSPREKLRILLAPPDVESMVLRVVDQVNSLGKGMEVQTERKEKIGVTEVKMCDWFFTTNNGKNAATLGKLLCIRLFEELHKLGYDLDLSSDLSRSKYQASALFFRKTTYERPPAKVVCVAPGKFDSMTLMNHDEKIKKVVLEAIQETWPAGISRAKDLEVLGHVLHDIEMNGNPWRTSEANIDNNRIICRIVGKLSQVNMKLLAGVDIKGGTDSLFFIQDDTAALQQSADFCSISLCKRDRLRLVDCVEMAPIIRQVILDNNHRIQDESIREHHAKFKMSGTPWSCSGYESVQARQLISRISEAMLRSGWALTDAIDISRREDDKSMLLFRRCAPTSARFPCIALTSHDHLRLVDFPQGDQEVLQSCISQHYQPGVKKYETTEPNCLKVYLAGTPWGPTTGVDLGWALHARSMLVHLLAAATKLGYRALVSADVSAKYHQDSDGNPEYPLDVHTIYLVKLAMQDQTKVDQSAPPSYQAAMAM
jgi:hypothetical protein